MKLHLGVINIGYGQAYGHQSNETTATVAHYLENKYHIMENFYEIYHDEITQILINKLEDRLRDALHGLPVTDDIFFDITAEIKPLFQKMIQDEQLNGRVAGVKTQAAKDGINHRKKNGITQKDIETALKNGTALVIAGKKKKKSKTKHDPRPSFMDTHLYYSSFVAWFE